MAAAQLTSAVASALRSAGTASFAAALARVHAETPNLYAKVLIHNFPFTVTRNDLITMHRMGDVRVGQVLRLGRVREVGGPSCVLRGAPLLPEGTVEVLATVMEHGQGARRVSMPHRQRKGPRPTKAIKPAMTVLRVQHVRVNASGLRN